MTTKIIKTKYCTICGNTYKPTSFDNARCKTCPRPKLMLLKTTHPYCNECGNIFTAKFYSLSSIHCSTCNLSLRNINPNNTSITVNKQEHHCKKCNDTHTTNWPTSILYLISLTLFILSSLTLSISGHNIGPNMLSAFSIILFTRTMIANIRREKNKTWILYLILAITSPFWGVAIINFLKSIGIQTFW